MMNTDRGEILFTKRTEKITEKEVQIMQLRIIREE